MKYSQWVSDLRTRNVSRFQEDGDDLGAGVIAEVLVILATDEQRRLASHEGTVQDLAPLKKGIRLTGSLLEEIQRQEPKALAGWRWSQPPANHVQGLYDELYTIAARLGFSIAEIERQHPELAPYFQAEREQYARRCEDEASAKTQRPTVLSRCRQFLRRHFIRHQKIVPVRRPGR